MKLNKRHQKTLKDIFDDPVRSNISWSDMEKLLAALDAQISEGKGSQVRIYLNGVRAVFHRSHPEKETDRGAVKAVRRFIKEAGVLQNVKI